MNKITRTTSSLVHPQYNSSSNEIKVTDSENISQRISKSISETFADTNPAYQFKGQFSLKKSKFRSRTLVERSNPKMSTEEPEVTFRGSNDSNPGKSTHRVNNSDRRRSETQLSPMPVSGGQLKFEVVVDENPSQVPVSEGSSTGTSEITAEQKQSSDYNVQQVKDKSKKLANSALEKLNKLGKESLGLELSKGNNLGCLQELGDSQANLYFANRLDRLNRAGDIIRDQLLDREKDGNIISLFVLTLVDNWNHEQERVVVVNQRSICVINYNFITEKITGSNTFISNSASVHTNESTSFQDSIKRIQYSELSRVIFGPMIYPAKSLLSGNWKKFPCLKLITSAGVGNKTKWGDLWIPFNKELPWTVLTSHPLACKVNGNRGVYQIEELHQTLCGLICTDLQAQQRPTSETTVTVANITTTNNATLDPSQTISHNSQGQQNSYNNSEQIDNKNQDADHEWAPADPQDTDKITSNSPHIDSSSTAQQVAQIIEEPILMESYVGFTSAIFNQSKLAFAMDRNGISF